MNKSFTLLESLVVLFIFTTTIVLVSGIYISLLRSNVNAQDFQLAFDNLRLGAERIWNEIKLGSGFIINITPMVKIGFKNRKCDEVTIYKDGNNIILETSASNGVPLFDPNLVLVKDFRVYYDNPKTSGAYYETSYKVFVLEYDVDLKGRNLVIPFKFWQTIAPLNAVLINNPCP